MTSEAFLQISEYYLLEEQRDLLENRRDFLEHQRDLSTIQRALSDRTTSLEFRLQGLDSKSFPLGKYLTGLALTAQIYPLQSQCSQDSALPPAAINLPAQEQHTPTSTNPPSTNKPDDPTRAPPPVPNT